MWFFIIYIYSSLLTPLPFLQTVYHTHHTRKKKLREKKFYSQQQHDLVFIKSHIENLLPHISYINTLLYLLTPSTDSHYTYAESRFHQFPHPYSLVFCMWKWAKQTTFAVFNEFTPPENVTNLLHETFRSLNIPTQMKSATTENTEITSKIIFNVIKFL